ncbi:hypothetical protein B296_00007730 [Ensete ventricosum]|uniref:Uncharacterized protein n=1 Tax=Ensete ventricosum TaxID=4639 RepID=A0A426YPX8_ENSVE|nr:hypothetical protein B296_00007730 [Ensete ventricosum]
MHHHERLRMVSDRSINGLAQLTETHGKSAIHDSTEIRCRSDWHRPELRWQSNALAATTASEVEGTVDPSTVLNQSSCRAAMLASPDPKQQSSASSVQFPSSNARSVKLPSNSTSASSVQFPSNNARPVQLPSSSARPAQFSSRAKMLSQSSSRAAVLSQLSSVPKQQCSASLAPSSSPLPAHVQFPSSNAQPV